MTPLPSIIQPSPAIPVAQSPPVPHGEASAHASEDYSPAMEVPSNESESTGPPWLITPDSLIIDYEVKRAVHELVKGHYKEPWTGWGKVPKDVRQRIFTFKAIYTWEPQHESSVLRHFNHEASEWLKKNLYLAHKLYKAPFPWMAPVVWEGLAEIGSSSTVIYRGGSVSTAVHRLRLAEELGREPTPKECFIRTYRRKDGTLEDGHATGIVEQFEKAIVDKCSQGVDEGSINQDELWDEIAIGSRNRVVGIVRQMSSSNYKPRAGPSESTEQLRKKVKELQEELARSRVEADVELARRELFESSLFAALRVQGIDLSSMPIIARTPHAPRAPTGESQTHADEYSPMLKRARVSPSIDNSLDDFDDDVGRD
ncbi:putative transposase Ptta/En/Spm plant protein [Dioscorea alata]|uniref:Transposase Ptta/En/Spm plant protein n=1 Tax=Dioscorea alata TaxID=55571 RepID=A0ACB7TSB0_DIOAL|nr:putative transposase Ptta/En/Spm plant protein [Dioscorea alata]